MHLLLSVVFALQLGSDTLLMSQNEFVRPSSWQRTFNCANVGRSKKIES